MLIQVHGGADVRGGYADAKLFKKHSGCDYFLDDGCYFEDIDWNGEWIYGESGQSPTDEQWKEIEKKHNVTEKGSVILQGNIAC